jgi:hypothetical protein
MQTVSTTADSLATAMGSKAVRTHSGSAPRHGHGGQRHTPMRRQYAPSTSAAGHKTFIESERSPIDAEAKGFCVCLPSNGCRIDDSASKQGGGTHKACQLFMDMGDRRCRHLVFSSKSQCCELKAVRDCSAYDTQGGSGIRSVAGLRPY